MKVGLMDATTAENSAASMVGKMVAMSAALKADLKGVSKADLRAARWAGPSADWMAE